MFSEHTGSTGAVKEAETRGEEEAEAVVDVDGGISWIYAPWRSPRVAHTSPDKAAAMLRTGASLGCVGEYGSTVFKTRPAVGGESCDDDVGG
jgi:hypothetical protein